MGEGGQYHNIKIIAVYNINVTFHSSV